MSLSAPRANASIAQRPPENRPASNGPASNGPAKNRPAVNFTRRPSAMAAIVVALTSVCVSQTGCSIISPTAPAMPSWNSFIPPALNPNKPSKYVPVGAGAALPSSSFNEQAYNAVRRAKENNSVVLQIIDDEGPVRVLPLPAAGVSSGTAMGSAGGNTETPTVYVSTLLKQTGLVEKLGQIELALFRPSPSSFEGVRMDVTLAGGEVRPETDYALRAGDRLVVRRDSRIVLDNMIDLVLGR